MTDAKPRQKRGPSPARTAGTQTRICAAARARFLSDGFEAIRRLSARAQARGKIRTDAPDRLPMLMMAPGLVVTVWNHLFADEALQAEDVFSTHIDLVFGDTAAQRPGARDANA